jgi:integrase
MAKKINYASLYTLRKDGRYQGSYTDEKGRHYVYDRDPEKLWYKLNTPKAPEIITFSSLAEDWKADHWERIGYKTAEAYTAPLRRIINHFGRFESISASDVSAYLAMLAKQGYSRRSVQMHRDILHMIYNYAIVSGKASVNPCTAVSLPRNLPVKKRSLPTDNAMEAVKKGGNQPFGLFALICLYAGCRRGEALALQYEDFDFQNNTIAISKSVCYANGRAFLKTPKTESGNRTVILLDKLKKYIPKCKKGFIFAEKDRNMLITEGEFQTLWEHYQKETGVTCTPHCLRHAYATMLFEAGLDVKDAQALMGHANISVTQDIYTHIRNARMKQAAEKLNRFDL